METKDWMTDAAKEANGFFGDGHPEDRKMLRDIIAKHCPFLPDTAYMRVPRCETCAHWQKDDAYVETVGRCEEARVWSDCGDYTIRRRANRKCLILKGLT